jgi:hypothetical protein
MDAGHAAHGERNAMREALPVVVAMQEVCSVTDTGPSHHGKTEERKNETRLDDFTCNHDPEEVDYQHHRVVVTARQLLLPSWKLHLVLLMLDTERV